MKVAFIETTTFSNFLQELTQSMNISDETIQYFQLALNVYLSALAQEEHQKFINSMPDFIHLSDEQNELQINSLASLNDLVHNVQKINSNNIPSKRLNRSKLKINLIIFFNVLQKYMPDMVFLDITEKELVR